MRRTIVALAAVCLAAAATAAQPDGVNKYEAAFERLKSLAGTWQIDERDEGVRYYLTGNESAVVEVFKNMSSVYHMDGDDLMVTHYCGAKNQPRMKAVDYDAKTGRLKFDFVDVTNVADPDDYYTREVEILFGDEDHVEVRFNGLENGKEFPVALPLTRKSRKTRK